MPKKKYQPNQKSIDVWDSNYTPIDEESENYPGSPGQFETFGDDLKFVLSYIKKNGERNIWTQVDGEDGDIWIMPGCHLVDRICYYITKEEWKSKDEQYYLGL